MSDEPADTQLLAAAFALAADLHRHQTRKGTVTPYLSHLLAVSALVLEDGANPTEAAAALLHDAAEDQGGHSTLELIAQQCGPEVAALVEECSDSLPDAGQPKAPWRLRKLAVLESLPRKSRGALLIIAADKLHNVRATRIDLAITGPEIWDQFKPGRDGFLWYHRALLPPLEDLLPQSRSVGQLRQELEELTQELHDEHLPTATHESEAED